MSSAQKFTLSSKKNPCPVCDRTKDGDCRISPDGHFVLCHSEISERQPKEELNGFIWLGSTENNLWGKWIAKSEDWQKSPRPTGQVFSYPFCNQHGQQIVEEVRVYQPNGSKKQWMEPSGVDTSQLLPYRYAESLEALKTGAKYCFMVEGPPKADVLWDLGLPAIAFANGFKSSRDSNWFAGFEDRLVIVPDRDLPGIEKAQRILKSYPMASTFKPWRGSAWWEPEWLPEKGGLDIKDWVEQQGGTAREIRDRILAGIERGDIDPTDATVPEHHPPEATFLQQAKRDLFPGDWISFGGILYEWTGSYYRERPDEALTPKIQSYCNTFRVIKTDRDGNETDTYPHAKPKFVKEVLDWVKLGCAVIAEEVNPPGINCTNGVLLLKWEGKTLKPEFVQHSPDRYYLSEPKIEFNPDADSTEYERLMDCLDPKARQIWERTIAAALDLPTVRKYRGRTVRALLLKGDGSNGKDTLRTLAQLVFGSGAFSSCSVTDFQEYDRGRAFPVYPLLGKLINWPSENADVGRIDQLRGLRAAITGDPITFEAKHRMAIQESPRSVFLFNLNESPNLIASLKATSSRWGIVPFHQTYSDHPAPGELKADPRFKEDPQFLAEQIAPAFLNQLLRQLQTVVNEGIDFSTTEGLLDEIQRESSHLLQFAADTGLRLDPNGTVTVKELWARLQQWYCDTGTLMIEIGPKGGQKLLWTDQAKRSDRNVKGANQVLPRILEIFPKARKGIRRTGLNGNRSETIITGICFGETGVRDLRTEPEPNHHNDFSSYHWGTDSPTVDQREPETALRTDHTEAAAPLTYRTPVEPDRTPPVPQSVGQLNESESFRENSYSDSVPHVAQDQEKFSPLLQWTPAVGNQVFYIGNGHLGRVCGNKVLTIEALNPDGTALLSHPDWLVTNTAPLSMLKLANKPTNKLKGGDQNDDLV